MSSSAEAQNILGLDPGRDKCGVAVVNRQQLIYHEVIDSSEAIAIIQQLCHRYNIRFLVMGDGTTSQTWREKIKSSLGKELEIAIVDEKNSTLEARDRYWKMYPPKGLRRLIPGGMRIPPRPVDDIVAILLLERYQNR